MNTCIPDLCANNASRDNERSLRTGEARTSGDLGRFVRRLPTITAPTRRGWLVVQRRPGSVLRALARALPSILAGRGSNTKS
jgi:hypothetical protein